MNTSMELRILHFSHNSTELRISIDNGNNERIPRKTRHPLEHKKSLILHHPPLLRPVSQKKSARDKRFAPLSKGESADHGSKAEHKGRKRASLAAFHECRAVSRLRLRRVSSGEWPEGKEKNRGGWFQDAR